MAAMRQLGAATSEHPTDAKDWLNTPTSLKSVKTTLGAKPGRCGKYQRTVVEAFCNSQSMIGQAGAQFGHNVRRFTQADDLMSATGKAQAHQEIAGAHRPILMACLPCTAWCRWSPFNLAKGNQSTIDKIMLSRDVPGAATDFR